MNQIINYQILVKIKFDLKVRPFLQEEQAKVAKYKKQRLYAIGLIISSFVAFRMIRLEY